MSTPLLENILNQPQALAAVGEHQFDAGRAALEQAAALLRSKKRVVLSGMGASLFACQALPYELVRLGIDAVAIETADLLYFTPATVDRNTAVVLVSRSGESVEITKAVPLLRERGASIIGIVNVPGSVLAQSADLSLVIGSPPDQMVAIQTYTGTVALLALLSAAIAGEIETAREELGAMVEWVKGILSRQVELRARWDELLNTGTPLYILGRGPSLGSVAEGVLLMHETAKAPAIGMSVAQFRHGPVEVVDERFRAVILGTRSETGALDLTLIHDLISMGANGMMIMERGAPERFIPIAEVVQLQLGAYRKAELNCVRPGEFRWAPLVTTSETGFGLSA